MKKINTLPMKRKFLFISISILFVYSIFFLICKKFEFLPVIYEFKTAKTYYMLTYVLLTACAYAIDTQKRKDPAYLCCFAIPLYSWLYLFLSFMTAGIAFTWIAVMTLVVGLIYLGLYFFYKKLLPKIINIKHLYGIVVFLYVIGVMTLVLYLGLSLFII